VCGVDALEGEFVFGHCGWWMHVGMEPGGKRA
jgi:hypothetical protein